MSLGGSKPSGSTTTVQKADPWSGIQPQLTQAANDTQALYGQGLLQQKYYPGSTVIDFAPETEAALNLTTQRALAGSPIQNQAKGLLNDTLSGTYLNKNPYLDAAFNRGADAVQGRVNSAFAGGGRFGGGINQEVITKELGNVAKDVYGGAYENERQRQMQGLLFAPQMAAADYNDINALAGVGSTREGLSAQKLQEDINRFNFDQSAPARNIQDYISLLNGAGGNYGSQMATSPYFANRGAGALGGGLLGASLGSSYGAGIAGALGSQTPWLFGGPTGAMIGGGLGLLGGLF